MNIIFGRPNINCDAELLKKIEEILNSGWVSNGTNTLALEYHFKEKFGVSHAISCASATTGLIIAIKAAGWKNCKVALPAFTWPSTLYALECNGNEPVFIDIEKDTWLIKNKQSMGAKHIIAVDTFGNQCHGNIYYGKENVIYDAAHGYGLPNLGKRGLAEVVSFSFTKVITATEGGMILTDDDELAETAYELRRLSGRMEEINALIAMESIKHHEENQELVHEVINKYRKHINVSIKPQVIPTVHNCSVLSILFEDSNIRDAVRLALAKHRVETKVYYDPLKEGLPNTDYVYQRILSLPIHKGVVEHQDEIIEIINTAARNARTPGKEYLTK